MFSDSEGLFWLQLTCPAVLTAVSRLSFHPLSCIRRNDGKQEGKSRMKKQRETE